MFAKILRTIAKGLGIFLLLVLIYVGAGWLLPKFHTNTSAYPNPDASMTIYLMTNGVHTDLVVPVRNEIEQWDTLVPFRNTVSKDTNYKWLAFGWGDKGFYLETPTWADLTFSTAFSAAAGLSTTAMHTTFYTKIKVDETCKPIQISLEQYQSLCRYIQSSFQQTSDKKYIWIPTNAVYGRSDAFYEAIGKYSLFKTCNSWTNEGLKAAGLPACAWTPLDTGLMELYTQLQPKNNR